jgi:hypothetical protein
MLHGQHFQKEPHANLSVRRRGDYVRKLLQEGVNKPKQGTDVGDHPPMYV